jgi:hypothetical protein
MKLRLRTRVLFFNMNERYYQLSKLIFLVILNWFTEVNEVNSLSKFRFKKVGTPI